MPSRLFHSYQLDESISNFWDAWCIFSFLGIECDVIYEVNHQFYGRKLCFMSPLTRRRKHFQP